MKYLKVFIHWIAIYHLALLVMLGAMSLFDYPRGYELGDTLVGIIAGVLMLVFRGLPQSYE